MSVISGGLIAFLLMSFFQVVSQSLVLSDELSAFQHKQLIRDEENIFLSSRHLILYFHEH